MGAIRNRRVPTAPEKGQLKPGVLRNHITQGGFQFGRRNVLRIQPAQDLLADRSRGVAGRLGRSEFTGITEDSEEITKDRLGQFRIGPGGRPKMAGISNPILHIFQDIEQVALWQAGLE